MTIDDAKKLIYQAFLNAWGSTTTIALDNNPLNEPVGSSWVRLSAQELISRQKTLAQTGKRKWERRGVAIVEIFAPQGVGGTQPADGYANTARLVFEGARLDPELVFESVDVVTIGVTKEDPAWYRVNVNARFTYYQTH